MSSKSEVGHAKNASNFFKIITFATGLGPLYVPNKASLKLSNLIAIHATAETDLATVITDNTAFNNRTNENAAEFSDVRPLATRLVNALEATDASPAKIKDARAFSRKLNGKRAAAITEPVDPNAPAPATISASQRSYIQQIQHLTGLNSVLISEPTYIPNEAPLKTATVATKITTLTTKNKAVAVSFTKVDNSRIKRDKTLYFPETGMVDVAYEVKKYVKSAFGATSPEYKQISGIPFKRPNKKKKK
jgi:hypothetical protein